MFLDVQFLNQENNNTIDAPTQIELNKLEIGDTVMVCHAFKSWGDEMLFVILTNVTGNALTGNVVSKMFLKHGFSKGDTIEFIKNNVYKVKYP